MSRPIATLALLLLFATRIALAAPAAPAAPAPRTETAVFAGGCFWSMESQFEGVPGVKSVLSGYTGGKKPRPTYGEVCTETTGHLESIQVTFDPAVITYAKLLDRFWHGIDPTQDDGQLFDVGESYRTAIFVTGPQQRREAEASKVALERSHVLHAPIVTRILDAGTFWPAEEYHQDYFKKNPEHYFAYRRGSGRDARLAELWGAAAVHAAGH
jgi:methionine-S-sulfoxide reductase